MADAHGSGPCGSNTMRVQVSSWKGFRNDPEASFIIKSQKMYRNRFYTPYKIDIYSPGMKKSSIKSFGMEEKWNTQEK